MHGANMKIRFFYSIDSSKKSSNTKCHENSSPGSRVVPYGTTDGWKDMMTVVVALPLEPEFAGSNPAKAVGFFRCPENPQYAFLRRGSKRICAMSQLCGM